MVDTREKDKMIFKQNTKLVLTGAAFLILIVGCSVAVTRVITNDFIDNLVDNGPLTSAKIVRAIRNLMNDTNVINVPIQAYIIPSIDAHQSEYVAERDRRIKYVSGFSGSFGKAVIEENIAALWTDSRYFIQAEEQLDNETWTIMKSGLPEVPTVEEWLIKTLPANSRIGIDPFLITGSEFNELSNKLEAKGHKLISIQQNLVDLVWQTRPELKLRPLEVLEYRFSGKRASDKVADIRQAILKLDAESLIVTALDDIAWLLNLRGSDIVSNPVFFGYVILTQNELHLYLLHEERITVKIENHFYVERVDVLVKAYNSTIAGINTVIRSTTGKVILGSQTSEAVQSVVPIERRLIAKSPIVMMKVIKNDIEAQGLRNAHIRDGAALVRYLYWLENEIDERNVTELSGAAKLREFRSQQEHLRGLSFTTISAVGANAALVHYEPTPETDTLITRNEIYLVDSGGQYLDGTTDITRTIHMGTPTKKEIDAFTRVLKGFISLNTAIFPPAAPYSFFDAMARRALWDVGLDYGHGTGHGVGAYLSVHEYPPLISSRGYAPGMLKNMFTSNEPGYYEEGFFGVRIEDVIQVVQAPNSKHYFNNRGALMFDDITMAPIQQKMINVNLLTENDVNWLNEYHQKVRKNLTPLLFNNPSIVEWLHNQTEAIKWNDDNSNENNNGTYIS